MTIDPATIAHEHIARAAVGLDLTDAHDRAIFRQRLDESMEMTKRSFIVDMARSLGQEVSGNVRRTVAVHAVAKAHLERSS